MTGLRRVEWTGTALHLAEMWRVTKPGKGSLRCILVNNPLGWELRLLHGEELIRSEVFRNSDPLLAWPALAEYSFVAAMPKAYPADIFVRITAPTSTLEGGSLSASALSLLFVVNESSKTRKRAKFQFRRIGPRRTLCTLREYEPQPELRRIVWGYGIWAIGSITVLLCRHLASLFLSLRLSLRRSDYSSRSIAPLGDSE